MNRITVKSKFLDANFVIETSSNLVTLNPRQKQAMMVRIFEKNKRDVVDYFVFGKDEEGWKMNVDRCLVCTKTRISSIYASLLVMYKNIYLEDFLEKVYLELSK